MRCPEVRDLLVPFLDGELDVEKNVQVLKHLELCPPCRGRSEEEGRLRELVVRGCPERLDEATKARILAGAFARDGAARGATRRRRALLAIGGAAAALLLGAGALFASNTLCLRGCPTEALLLQARDAMRSEPLPLEVVEQEFKRHIQVPGLLSTQLLGASTLRSSTGCPCQPMVRFGCEGGQLCFFVIPHGHAHVGERRALPDGREYLVVERGELRFVGWIRPDGALVGCMPCSRLRQEQLFVLASALRDSSGRM